MTKRAPLLYLLFTLLIPSLAHAEIPLSSKVPVSFYGFICFEMLWSDSQLSTFGTNNNLPDSYNRTIDGFNRVVDESVDGRNRAFLSATPQNTRFGFLLKPYNFNDKNFEVDARLELDFFSASNTVSSAVTPRIRRAYAGIGGRHWHVLLGQEWDLFAPLNTATMNLGGNLWRQGNLGFRRPQLRFTYKNSFDETSGLEAAVSTSLPSNSFSSEDLGNATGIPMAQASFGYWQDWSAGRMKLYLSGVYARHHNAVSGASDVNNWGVAFSADLPFHRLFHPFGEFQYGQSLGLLLSNSSDTSNQRFLSGWGTIKSLWLDWLETNAGYGIEHIRSAQVATGWVKDNRLAYFNIMFKPIGALSIGGQYGFLSTDYQGSPVSRAHTALFNTTYYF